MLAYLPCGLRRHPGADEVLRRAVDLPVRVMRVRPECGPDEVFVQAIDAARIAQQAVPDGLPVEQLLKLVTGAPRHCQSLPARPLLAWTAFTIMPNILS